MNSERIRMDFCLAGSLALLVTQASAATVTWTGAGADSNWFTAANWSPANVPTNNDDVLITNKTAILSNSTEALRSLIITNATLIFTNWDSLLVASDVVVRANGTMTHAANSATTTNATGQWTPDARIRILCTNLTVEAGGTIHGNGKGYVGGVSSRTNGCGPGFGSDWNSIYGSGAGYGGVGGNAYFPFGGATYGSPLSPTNPGSGGAYGNSGNGGAGGGAIRIEANNAVTVHGSITARGLGGAGGGSGGGIYITCLTFGGTNGLLSVQGGNGAGNGAAGGGGRIAVIVDAAAQSNAPVTAVQFSAGTGMSYYDNGGEGWPGSIYLTSPRLLGERLQGGELIVPGTTEFSANSLTISNGLAVMTNNWRRIAVSTDFTVTNNGGLLFAPTGGVVTVGGNLSVAVATRSFTLYAASDVVTSLWVGGNAQFANDHVGGTYPTGTEAWNGRTATGAVIWIGGNLTLTNNGIFHVYSGPTNAVRTNWGTRVSISGDLKISSGAWLQPHSYDANNGGSVYLSANNLVLTSTNGGVEASGLGYPSTYGGYNGNGPGGGKVAGDWYGSGGGYGGMGGGGANNGSTAYTGAQGITAGTNYDSALYPLQPGSSGGGGSGGNGGGLICLDIAGWATLNGTFRANGGNGQYGGAGSGGGIYLKCRTLAGINGILQANGGRGATSGYLGGGGGGGRIAIWRIFDQSNTNAWTIQANGGAGAYTNVSWDDGQVGTLCWGQLPLPSTVLILR